ncbi:MAG TPA: response regulator [Planctomycetaceae bacterium]|nr:response regulator [Planctomycetaceae bacterium]
MRAFPPALPGFTLADDAECVLDSVRDALLVLDRELRIVWANRSFYRTFPTTPEQTLGQYLYEFRDGEWNIPRLRTLLENVLPRDAEFEDFEVDQNFRDVGSRTMLLNARCLRAAAAACPAGPAPDCQFVLLVINDISERRRSEVQKARLAALVESSPDAIIIQTLAGTITDWNSGAERAYGYTANEAVGQHISLIMPDGREAECADIRARLAQGERLEQFETVRVRKDGRHVHASLTISPIRNSLAEITRIATIERDVTRRIQIEDELRVAMERAEAGSRAQAEFLTNVSHELRTPMNAIIGMTDLALDEDLSAEVRDYLETARGSAEVLLELLNEVLDFSKLESGEFELDAELFSLSELLEATLKALALKAYEKGLELACDLAPGIPDRLIGDPLRLRQIVTNLAGNAIKFTHQGEILISVEPMALLEEEIRLKFSVRDSGIGIPKEDQQRVFQPFTQVDSSITRNYSGTGLGLAISTQLINRMGGRIWLDSEVGQGSTFHFTAQFGLTADAPQSDAALAAEHVEDLRGLPVLVVDDNETSRRIVERCLSNWSMEPVAVADGRTALEAMRDAARSGRRFPLVILDALMPEMDGFMLADQIRQDPALAEATILMLSSADRQAFRERCRDLPIRAFLEKPVTQSDLLDSIVTALGGALPEEPRRESDRDEFPRGEPLSLLVVEDTPANQKVVVRMLERRGHAVQVAHNGREAIDLLSQCEFDLVLMDVQMPIMDGFQATAAIRAMRDEQFRNVPIVAMTAHAMKGDRERCLAAGMDAYIAKPINARRLIRIVERLAAGSRFTLAAAGDSMTWDSETPLPLNSRPPGEAPPIDVAKALKRLDGDRNLLTDMAGFFNEDAPELLRKIELSLERGDAQCVQRSAHSLKGLAANFNADRAVAAAFDLEQLGESGDLSHAVVMYRRLRREVQRVIGALEQLVAQP